MAYHACTARDYRGTRSVHNLVMALKVLKVQCQVLTIVWFWDGHIDHVTYVIIQQP
jgi:hypothetical protein